MRTFSASLQRLFLVCFLIPIVLFGCGSSDDGTNNIEKRKYPDGDIEKFIWETNGGGDIKFSIERQDNNFKIAVERYEFHPNDTIIILTDADSKVYGVVKDIFDKTINIYDYTFDPQGPTGSWTTITLIFSGNHELAIDNIDAWDGKLRNIYDYVTTNTQPLILKQQQ